jgi:UDP-glucose 4-epimerase
LASEHYFDFYGRQHGLEPVIFRFFNIFGPRQDPSSPYSGVISIFSERAQNGLPITVFGDGEQTRFCLRRGSGQPAGASHRETAGGRRRGQRWLERGDEPQADADGAQEVIGELPPVSYGPARSGDIRHSRANNRRLLERFTRPQQTPLSVGLARLLGR